MSIAITGPTRDSMRRIVEKTRLLAMLADGGCTMGISKAALVVGFLAQGCAFVQNQDAIDARTALIGRSRPEIMACAGIPNKVAKAGTKEIATYSVADRYSASGVVLGLKDCTVDIVFEAGRVASVDYFVEDPGPIAPLESCAEIVSTCLRQ